MTRRAREAFPGRLPARDVRGHKGTFGTVAVIGGCCAGEVRMIGAAALAAAGALRAGCGLARLVMPGPVLEAGLVMVPSATGRAMAVDAKGEITAAAARRAVAWAAEDSGAMVVGPGLGSGAGAEAVVQGASEVACPLVLDADGLNALARVWTKGRGRVGRGSAVVLTPHPGEFVRLARAAGIRADGVLAGGKRERTEGAQRLAERMGCVVVLKGAGTVVADAERAWVCECADAALATAGTGDVLAGVIGGLMAQAYDGPRSVRGLCAIAVEAHARAAALWRLEHAASAGLMAMELAELVPAALEGWRG
jgi:hydroxyethylthiazole kinase-like uncharacterized protein yjeF